MKTSESLEIGWGPSPPSVHSRYVVLDDPVMAKFRAVGDGGEELWDFHQLEWWSRIYEYRWLQDVVRDCFADRGTLNLESKVALDAGCGRKHPSSFILGEMGFRRVLALDLMPNNPLFERVRMANVEYRQTDFAEHVPGPVDFLCCLSVLEHVPRERQPRALENLCGAVAPGGFLAMTFDLPGFEYETDLEGYKRILSEQGFEITEAATDPAQRLTSRNGPIPHPGWPKVGRMELLCYRLLAWKEPG
ncbi:MAG: class I SAM-dependent methyltransferase [Acidobacteriota bacterium]|nr:class I SAM-dependent methyltransferase [Acidobacteriota bacterium]